MSRTMTVAELKAFIEEFNDSAFAKGNGMVVVTDKEESFKTLSDAFMSELEKTPAEKEAEIPKKFSDMYNALSAVEIKEGVNGAPAKKEKAPVSEEEETPANEEEAPKEAPKKRGRPAGKVKQEPKPEVKPEEEETPEEETGMVTKKELEEALDWYGDNRPSNTLMIDLSDYGAGEEDQLVSDVLDGLKLCKGKKPPTVQQVFARLTNGGAAVLKLGKLKGAKPMAKPVAKKAKAAMKATKVPKAPKAPKEKKITPSSRLLDKMLSGANKKEDLLKAAKKWADEAGQKQFQTMGAINAHLKWLGQRGFTVKESKDGIVTVKAPAGK
jgi:hypothetical protein